MELLYICYWDLWEDLDIVKTCIKFYITWTVDINHKIKL